MQTSMKAAHFNLSKWSHEDAMKSHSLCDPDICTILMSKHFFVLDPGLNYLPKFDKKKKKEEKLKKEPLLYYWSLSCPEQRASLINEQ